MPTQNMLDILETIDWDMKRKDMIVLGALLKVQSEPTTFIDFESLREQLAKDEGGKKGKDSLIYRSLSWLEHIGLIQIDRSGHKHGYNSNVKMMHDVLKKQIIERSSDLVKESKALDTEIQTISEISTDTLAADIIALASGAQPLERPLFAQGWQNIIKLLDDKVYRNIKKNDIIRFTLEWYDRPQKLEEPRLDLIEEMLKKGVEVRGLEHRRLNKKRIKRFAEKMEEFLQKGYKAGFRVCPRNDSTYQFVGRNTEGIMLIISENPLSVTWFPKSANPELVDNAIQSFDKDFLEGYDVSVLGE